MGETAFFRGEGGVVWEMDLPLSEDMQVQLVKGRLMRVNPDGSTYTEPVAEADEGDEPEVEQPPAQNAPKAAWVGYVHRVHGLPIDEAEALTKHDLMELAGSA
jgi:hypothetical protein